MDSAARARVERSAEIAQVAAGKIWRTAPHVLDKEELTSIAYEGLCQAASRWDAFCLRHGYSTDRDDFWGVYAYRRCFGAIMDTLRQRDHASRSLRARYKRLKEAGLEAGVSYDELAELSGMNAKNVASTIHLMNNKPGYLEDEDHEDLLSRDEVESDQTASAMSQSIVASIMEMTAFQQYVLVQRYYFGRRLADIRGELRLNEQHVSQAHITAVLGVLDSARDTARAGSED